MAIDITRKLDALHIIISCPLWPDRANLNTRGQELYDLVLYYAKIYALAIADERWRDAMDILSLWTKPLNSFIDHTHINDDVPAKLMIAVYNHYAGYSLPRQMVA